MKKKDLKTRSNTKENLFFYIKHFYRFLKWYQNYVLHLLKMKVFLLGYVLFFEISFLYTFNTARLSLTIMKTKNYNIAFMFSWQGLNFLTKIKKSMS